MKKKIIKFNRLIIRKNLLGEIRNNGISKSTPEAVDKLMQETGLFISDTLSKVKENMDINARKTMKKQDIIEALKQSQPEFDI